MFNRLKSFAQAVYKAWQADDTMRLAAAIAFYTALSVAPLLVLVVSAAGFWLNDPTLQNELVQHIQQTLGAGVGNLVQSLIDSATNYQAGFVATLFALGAMLFGALNVFSQLRSALNIIWDVDEPRDHGWISTFLVDKLLSFGMMLVAAFLMLVSLVLSTTLSFFEIRLRGDLPQAELLITILSVLVSLSLITLLFALIFKFLPNAHITWRDVGVGALFTAVLFTLGERLLTLFLIQSPGLSVYGAVSTFMVVLFWLYYAANALLLGAQFTRVYTERYGEDIEATELAFGTD